MIYLKVFDYKELFFLVKKRTVQLIVIKEVLIVSVIALEVRDVSVLTLDTSDVDGAGTTSGKNNR